MSTGTQIISEIQMRIVEIVDAATQCPELRRLGRVLASEFAEHKFTEGLEAKPEEIDIETSARVILKKQLFCLYESRKVFTPMEQVYLQHLCNLIAKI